MHNPKGLHYAEDLLFWDSHLWKNSGLIWNETISGGRWCPKPSGVAVAGGGTPVGSAGYIQYYATPTTFGGESSFTYTAGTNTLTIAGAISSQIISANRINSAYLNAISSNLDAKIDAITGVGRGGYASVANGGTISHGFGSLPNNVSLAPSGSAAPLVYSFKVDTSNITVYHSSKDSEIFSWRCEGTDPGTDAANGWHSIAACLTGQVFAHGLSSKPINFYVCPSGTSPIAYTASCDATNIKIIHSSKTAEIFSWRGEI